MSLELASQSHLNLTSVVEKPNKSETFLPLSNSSCLLVEDMEQETIESDSDTTDEKDISPKKRISPTIEKHPKPNENKTTHQKQRSNHSTKQLTRESSLRKGYERKRPHPEKLMLRAFIRPKSHFFRVRKREKYQSPQKTHCDCREVEILLSEIYPVCKKLIKLSPMLTEFFDERQKDKSD